MSGSRDVENFYENGVWKNRRLDCAQPFSTGSPQLRQLAIGAEVARWNEGRHIIRDTDGTIIEINVYGPGPYPHRSPAKTARPAVESP
jgi:hypothetical protein